MTGPATAPIPPSHLVRLSAGAMAGTGAKKGRIPLPDSLLIAKWGTSHDLSGAPVTVNDVTLAELAANQKKFGFEEVALDFNHATVPGTDAEGKPVKPAEPLPIAAMGTLSVRRNLGILFTPTSWTPEGEAAYTGRHYRDLSPTVGRNAAGEVTFIHSVALTRSGQIPDLHAFHSELLPPLTALTTHTPAMDTPDYRSAIIARFKLEPDATDEQIIAALEKPEPEPATPVTPLATAATPELTALSARLDQMERDNLLAEAARAGKVIPLSAESLALTPLSVLKDIVAKAAVTVPLTPTVPATAAPALKALSADEAAVAARMGYTPEQWRAANPV